MILAGIDIGTNSLRLLIAEAGPDRLQKIYSDRKATRLGMDLDRTGTISREAEGRALAALTHFADRIKYYEACHVAAVGTSALRNASNADVFLKHVQEETGLAVTVISGEEEARLTFLGVVHAGKAQWDKDCAASALVIDIGGGSTEMIATSPGRKIISTSLSLGAVYLTERFIKHDPPSTGEIQRMRKSIRETLNQKQNEFEIPKNMACIGTAGTVSTLAAMDQRLVEYDPDKINGYILTRKSIHAITKQLVQSTHAERSSFPGLEHGREDIIATGTIILEEIMLHFNFRHLHVSEGGLREGLILDIYERYA
ncbi:MAG: Ppx/GppA phosphatase family protein [Nitrospirota bacterium]